MGMNLNPPSSGGRMQGRTSLSEINVTPMVDVMLVLLIIFMVSAPLLQQGVDVNLPKASAGAITQTSEPIVISIDAKQTITLDSKSYALSALSEKLGALSASRPNLQVLVQADQAVNYGVVAKVMAMLKKAQIHRVGLVTAPEN